MHASILPHLSGNNSLICCICYSSLELLSILYKERLCGYLRVRPLLHTLGSNARSFLGGGCIVLPYFRALADRSFSKIIPGLRLLWSIIK